MLRGRWGYAIPLVFGCRVGVEMLRICSLLFYVVVIMCLLYLGCRGLLS